VWDVLALQLDEASNKPGGGFDVGQRYMVRLSFFFLFLSEPLMYIWDLLTGDEFDAAAT